MSATTTARTIAPASGKWQLDPSHSDLKITARHIMVSKVRGSFESMTGTINVADDITDSTVEVEAKAASVTTGVEDRDNHLRSPDFLDAENHPIIRFASTGLSPKGEAWQLSGDLTIRGITKPVVFDLSYEGSATDPYGNQKAAFTVTGEIEREEWGLTWNVPLEGGGLLVSKKLQLEFDAQAVLQT